MSHQNTLMTKKEVKSPAVFLFGAVFIFAVVLSMSLAPSQGLVYVGMSAGIVLACMAIPSVFFISDTADLFLRGRIDLTQAVPAILH